MGFWDILLLVAVSLQATAIAYLSAPKWKALLITIPLPFSIAFMAVRRPVDATNVLGLVLLLIFTYGVRFLHMNLKIHVIPAIVASALTYCLCGWALAGILPANEWIFWVVCAAVMVLAIFLMAAQTHGREKNHRSYLPIWLKLPIILGVVFCLLLAKKQLVGFMTVFPMVGVVAAYEGRYCLGTLSRQIPIVMCSLTPMMIFIKLAQGSLGIEMSLALSWIVFGVVLIPLTRRRFGGGVQSLRL